MRMRSYYKVGTIVGEELRPLLLLVCSLKYIFRSPVRVHDDEVRLLAGFL